MNEQEFVKNEPPFFSIVTVTFNDLLGLKRTANSVSKQVETDFEWIIVDGGSSDGTVEFLKSLRLNCLKWCSEKDRGIYDAMNKGTAIANGKYVVYLNGGDAFTNPKCLSSVRQVLSGSRMPELCYGGANWLFMDGSVRYRGPRPLESAISHGLPGMHQSTYYLREFLEAPPYDLDYKVSADYYISAICFLRGAKACYINEALADFTVGGNSMVKRNASLRECWRVQRDILGIGFLGRMFSAIRRWVSFRILMALHYGVHRTGSNMVP